MTLQELQDRALQLPVSDRTVFSSVFVKFNSTGNAFIYCAKSRYQFIRRSRSLDSKLNWCNIVECGRAYGVLCGLSRGEIQLSIGII